VDANRFDELLDRCHSAEATPAELAELNRLLRGDAELRRRFVEHSLLEVQLYKAFAGLAVPAPTPTSIPMPAPTHSWRPRRWLAAALVLLAAGVGLFFAFHRKTEPAVQVASGEVKSGKHPAAAITPGEPFEVVSLTPALVRFADASLAELDPGSQGIVRGKVGDVRQVIELTQGGGVFHVTHGGGQFRVDTPLGTVTALGTQFTVKLKSAKGPGSEKGKRTMAVVVTEGTVEVHSNGKRRVLSAGQGRSYGDDGEQNNGEGQQNNRDDGNRDDGNQGQR
jgi:ferric-dicitrate binding protein FerR (iron transport regulator)